MTPMAARASLVLLGSLLWFGCAESPTVLYTQPTRQDLSSVVTTNGQVEAGQRAEIYAETSGRVTAVFVKEAQRVRKGERLLAIEDDAAQAELKRARAQLAAAKAELEGVEQGGSAAEIAELENELAAAKRASEQLEEDMQSLERLVEKQAVPRVDLDAARRELKQTRGRIGLLEKQLAVRVSPHQTNSAEARVREAEAAVALAEQRVGSATLEAPMEGVVYSLPVRAGAYVQPGTLVARVGKLGEVDVVIYVDEPELGRVRLGAPVTITSDAYPGKSWTCQVDRLPAEVISLETRRVGEVHCTVSNADELIPNLRVSIEIESASAENVLTLPREAVLRDGEESWVWVANESDRAERKVVEPGIADASRVEIRSGLTEQERVLLPGGQPLTQDETLRLTEARGAER